MSEPTNFLGMREAKAAALPWGGGADGGHRGGRGEERFCPCPRCICMHHLLELEHFIFDHEFKPCPCPRCFCRCQCPIKDEQPLSKSQSKRGTCSQCMLAPGPCPAALNDDDDPLFECRSKSDYAKLEGKDLQHPSKPAPPSTWLVACCATAMAISRPEGAWRRLPALRS